MKNVTSYNESAWNHQARSGNKWTIPVAPDVIAKARQGDWEIVLTPVKAVPREWFGELKGKKVLGLASGGGQQCPVLAAAGADVTLLDFSAEQLGKDRLVAERDGLEIATVQGDMRDLSVFADNTFDLIFHPVSNTFIPDVLPVWREAFRVLKPGGELLAGVINPVYYLFSENDLLNSDTLTVRYKIPFSDLEQLSDEERQKYIDDNEPLVFGHTLDDQIGGQLRAGFVLIDMYEDGWPEVSLDKYIKSMLATRARKP
jgi:SAM-dependent methyltransferase